MITLGDFDQIVNGAQFVSADIHVHSFGGSHDVKDPSMTPQAIVDAAMKAGTKVLALTDHNSIANTRISIDYAQKYAGELLVLAAVEVTTAHGHLLAYFSPDDLSKIESFVAMLGIVSSGTSESHTSKSMSDVIAEVARFGGLAIAAHIDRKTGFEASAPGFPNWKKDIVASPGLVGFEVASIANINWYSGDDTTPEAADRKKLLSNRERVIGRRAPLAHVQNSDAHTLADFVGARTKRASTRIKMTELNFDGFRTAFADPEARVRATAALPIAIPRILAMHVSGGFLRDEKFRFSDNLNCFIGGRGTGKSTALKCLAYALGTDDRLAEYDNCPDSVIVYCVDAAGVTYRYERMRGSAPEVRAKEDKEITDVPADSFQVEFFGQGDLADVARDPLRNAQQFQEFLDRNTRLTDLLPAERELVEDLRRNGTQLRPLESQAASRARKNRDLDEIKKKLVVAEEGKLRDLVTIQTRVAAEKTLVKSYKELRESYARGISLSNFQRDAQGFETAAGTRTGSAPTELHLSNIRSIVEESNAYLQAQQGAITVKLKEVSSRIDAEISAIASHHQSKDAEISGKVAEFQKQGLTASVADLQRLVKQGSDLTAEIGRIDLGAAQLNSLRNDRLALLGQLEVKRSEITERRKDLVRQINKHLATVIEDYTVVVKLDVEGIVDEFVSFVLSATRGSYLQEDVIRRMATKISPSQLASMATSRDANALAVAASITPDSAQKVCDALQSMEKIHDLELIWKSPRPTISVIPKGAGAKPIPINQLSDGQKHTIFLTIALLADSDSPLIIDQPEDDLDNAFIFSSVVETLRRVKERRQILVVTHNSNIAVLGDAELLFPMQRQDDRGISIERGAIDRRETRDAVQKILEGGEQAFRRRMEIYGY